MLQASRRGFFKRSYQLAEDGRPVTELTGFRRESCSFTVDSQPYEVHRERRKRFTLSGPGGVVATADRAGGRQWTIGSTAGKLELVRPSLWRSHWELRRGSRSMGTVRHAGGFGRSSIADLAPDIPLPLRVFAYYVVLMVWERAAAAAANSGGG